MRDCQQFVASLARPSIHFHRSDGSVELSQMQRRRRHVLQLDMLRWRFMSLGMERRFVAAKGGNLPGSLAASANPTVFSQTV